MKKEQALVSLALMDAITAVRVKERKQYLIIRPLGNIDGYMPTLSNNYSSPIYIPKRHDKKTWAQQGRDAKKRKRKIGR